MTNLNMDIELKAFYDGMDFVRNPKSNLYEACIGDDVDSYTSAMYLKHVAGIETTGFFDFSDLYMTGEHMPFKRMIGCDMSLLQDGFRCWDNHIALVNEDDSFNSQCANINLHHKINASSKSTYHKKFAGSTALQMFAYYDGDKPKTEEGALIWISLDTGYKGHYNAKFKPTHNAYLEELGLTWMIDVLNKYTITELNRFLNVNGLNSKVKLNKEGRLINVGKWMKNGDDWTQGKSLDVEFMEKHLGFSFELPKEKFTLRKQFYRESADLNTFDINKLDKNNVFSLAFTYNNKIELTTMKKGLY